MIKQLLVTFMKETVVCNLQGPGAKQGEYMDSLLSATECALCRFTVHL